MIKIIPFQNKHQEQINALIAEIAQEFKEPISAPPTARNKSKAPDKYWIATKEDKVIGTIALLKIKNKNAILKNMFVKKQFRGKEQGVSNLLLRTAVQWCQDESIRILFLGTMRQFKAAHRFYEKNGFQKIKQIELPTDFLHNPIDAVFYKKEY